MGGGDIDGIDQWGAVMEADGTEPRTDSIQYVDGDGSMTLVLTMEDGYSISYHKGAEWCDVLDSTETVTYTGEAIEETVCTDLGYTLSATQFESASALFQTVT